MDEPRLTVSGAARRLGVAPGTLRTWDRRYGVGPTDHTRGLHRRYSAVDMTRLELMLHALVKGASPAEAARYALTAVRPGHPPATAPPPAGTPHRGRGARSPDSVAGLDVIASLGAPAPGRPRVVAVGDEQTHTRGLVRAALALDPAAIRRVVEDSIDRHGVAVSWDEVVGPAVDAIDARVRRTGRDVEVARLLGECAAVVFHIRAYAAAAAQPMRPVLSAGMPGDEHGVPLAALGALLAQRRIACRSLGAALPADALAAAVRKVAPAALVLWSQLTSTADVDVLAGLPVTRPRLRAFVLGPGWDGVALPRGVDRLASLTDAADRIGEAVLR